MEVKNVFANSPPGFLGVRFGSGFGFPQSETVDLGHSLKFSWAWRGQSDSRWLVFLFGWGGREGDICIHIQVYIEREQERERGTGEREKEGKRERGSRRDKREGTGERGKERERERESRQAFGCRHGTGHRLV